MPTPPHVRPWQRWALVALCTLLSCAHAWRYYPFLADDTLISLRYAQRLLQGHGLNWDSFHPVEGYSNLLWTLGAAGFGALGMDLIVAVRVMGVACAGAMIAGLVWYGTRWRRDATLWPSLGAGLVCVCSGTIAVWIVGGLEQTLVAAALALATVCVLALSQRHERPHAASPWILRLGQGALVALVLTRPDAPLLVASLGAGFVLASRGSKLQAIKEVLWMVGPSVVAYLGVLGFRLMYYGEWVPNTAYVKIALTPERLKLGWGYVREGLWTCWPLGLALVVFTHRRSRLPWRPVMIVGLPALLWLMYLVFIGGDIFPGRRHFAPVIPLFALILSEVMAAFERQDDAPGSGVTPEVMGARLTLVLGAFFFLQWEDPAHDLAKTERWEWVCKEVATDLKTAFGPRDPLFAVTAAGCFPYWTQFRSLDLLGLNDHHIARNPPEGFGKGFLAHDLGDPDYTWARKPDLIHSGVPGGGRLYPHFGFGASQMQERPEFHDHYMPMHFEGQGYQDQLHLRYTSERVGVRQEKGGGLWLPAHLFASSAQARAKIGASGTFVLPLRPGQTLSSPAITLDPGRYTLRAVGLLLPTRVLPAATKVGALTDIVQAKGLTTFRLREPATITFRLTAPLGTPGELEGVRLGASAR